MNKVAVSFVLKPVLVEFEKLLPCKTLTPTIQDTYKFRQVKASIEEVGLIEPLTISTVDRKSGQHLLLDGHIRLTALKDLGETQALCLVANDDETYTYNNRVNRLSSVQEHLMIRRAIERGLSPERLTSAQLEANSYFPGDRLFAIENGPSGFDPAAPVHQPKIKYLVRQDGYEYCARITGIKITPTSRPMACAFCAVPPGPVTRCSMWRTSRA